MKFIVEFRIKPGNKNKVVETFEQLGPNRHPGVTFRSAWIAKHADLAYVLVESTDESLVASAAKSWSDLGDTRITEVIDAEQF